MAKLKMYASAYGYLSYAIKCYMDEHSDAVRKYAQNHSARRVRWDVARAAFKVMGESFDGWLCEHCYDYLNDTHVDSALRLTFTAYELTESN